MAATWTTNFTELRAAQGADSRRRLGDRWLFFLALVLLGYALAGRGFAYVGFPPLYIGEICLFAGLFVWLTVRGWTKIFHVGAALAVLPLALLGTIRLVPGVQQYQIEALRDAVVWGYAAFAMIVASLLCSEPRRLLVWLSYYKRFSKIFLIGIPLVFCLYHFFHASMPEWPWQATPIIQEKEGDVLVHLAGILAFWMADPKRKVGWLWTSVMTLDMAMMGVVDRAGLLSFGVVMMICLLAKPLHGAAWRTIAMLLCGVVLLWASQINVAIPGAKGRDISWEQFEINFKSMFGYSDNNGLDSTKEWRLDWWHKIIGYTVHGPYFWTGKGFGINLANDDGFQVNEDKSLRSPHSVHMTFLARMGVPGLALWAFVQVTWLFSVGESYLRSRWRGQQRWAGLFLFIFAYYIAFIINGSFDVFIEGPMGGIWYWTIYGTGVAALWIWRTNPEVLVDDVNDESAGRAQFLPAAGRGRSGLLRGVGAA